MISVESKFFITNKHKKNFLSVKPQLNRFFSRCMMGNYDFEKMENEITLAMMVKHRVREPTLCQVQLNSENFEKVNFSSTPSWVKNSELHPGLPEHYLTVNAMDDLDLPDLPFKMNREILHKLIVRPSPRKTQKLPQLIDLMNGTVVITGPQLIEEIKYNVEVFFHLHDKLLPCCYAQRSDIIANSPFARSRARVYYIPEASTAAHEISFISASSKILQRCPFSVKWLQSSVPYNNLHH